ncbi:MAG: SIS domain-containing protein [Deltaproteobacteria bacterium]|nr:SIS domain-containing protein [Deltaproteobacteria bacterium]
MKRSTHEYIEDIKKILDTFPHEQFELMIDAFLKAYSAGRHIFVMGNGGSASTASHWVCDINKGCSSGKEKRFKMLCLNDSISTMLAYANDLAYEDIFLEQLKNFFDEGDVVVGISASGNSLNVIKAVDYAKAHGGITVGLCGYAGGELYHIVDIPLLIKIDNMQKVEDVHMIVVHMTMQRLLQELNQGE